MKEFKIDLCGIDKVKVFARFTSSECEGGVSIHSGRWVIDGKSIMGIFSLDLSKPVHVFFDSEEDGLKLYNTLVADGFKIETVE